MARPKAFVYIVRCRDGTLYIGTARDIAKRLAQHNAGKGAKYTAGRRPVSRRAVNLKRHRAERIRAGVPGSYQSL